MLIFAEKKADVDAIHEYLLLKGVEAVAIHGGKGWWCMCRHGPCCYSGPSPNPLPCLASHYSPNSCYHADGSYLTLPRPGGTDQGH